MSSNFFSIDICADHITVAGLTRSSDSSFRTFFIHHKPFENSLDLTQIATDKFQEKVGQSIQEILLLSSQVAEKLLVTFQGVSCFSISLAENHGIPESDVSAQLTWELEQITNQSVADFSVLMAENKRFAMLMPKIYLAFSKYLASSLGKELAYVGLPLLGIHGLLGNKINPDSLILSINNTSVEIAVVTGGNIEKSRILTYKNGLDINDMNITLRKLIDVKSHDSNAPNLMYMSGVGVDKELAEQIANATQIKVELVDPFKFAKFSSGVKLENESPFIYSAAVSAGYQV